jgi:hypothetical protein
VAQYFKHSVWCPHEFFAGVPEQVMASRASAYTPRPPAVFAFFTVHI